MDTLYFNYTKKKKTTTTTTKSSVPLQSYLMITKASNFPVVSGKILFFLKFQFFRSTGKVIQQIKVSPYVTSRTLIFESQKKKKKRR